MEFEAIMLMSRQRWLRHWSDLEVCVYCECKTKTVRACSKLKCILRQFLNIYFYHNRTAEVEIRLRNKGPDAYKHELYGDSVVIQRKISADGGTRYALKSERGRCLPLFKNICVIQPWQ